MKKIFVIAFILLVLLTAALVVYNLFFKDKEIDPNLTPTPSAGAEISPGVFAQGALRAISKEKIMAPAIGKDGQTVKYYSRQTGRVFESDFLGQELKEISDTDLKNLIKIVWSPDGEKVIGVFSENNQTKKYFFDYETRQSAELNSSVGWVVFSPDSKNIVYQYNDPATGQSNISVSSPDGSNWRNVFKTRMEDLIVEWPSREKISIRTRVSGLAQGLLYAIEEKTGNFYKILSDTFGLSVNWSPKADKVLFSYTDSNGRNPQLVLSDEKGEKTKKLNLKGIADKCVWSKDNLTVFCALPQSFSDLDVWPDDYYKGLIVLNDAIYKIDLETDQKTKIAGSLDQAGFDAQDLLLSPKEDYLFFINQKDGLLYSLKL